MLFVYIAAFSGLIIKNCKSKLLAKKQKYYVVWEGVTPGIYTTWAECQLQIKGYANARYKSYKTLAEAQTAYGSSPLDANWGKGNAKSQPKANHDAIIKRSLSVDAACSGNPGLMEYQGVWTDTKEVVFRQGPFKKGTNNIGEFLALVHGLAHLQKVGLGDMPIYSDSRTAMAWVRNKKVKTTLKKTEANAVLFDLMNRGVQWLHEHKYNNRIIKWDTVSWGEIPADFGRK